MSGFTLPEILIAIAIFSTVLVALVYSVSSFFASYNNSLISSSAQNTVQNISDTIEAAMKYSESAPQFIAPTGNGIGLLCAGDDEFAFYSGDEIPLELPMGVTFGLYELPIPAGTCPADPQSQPTWSNGISLLGDHYRIISLSTFQLADPSTEWAINIKLAYTSGGTDNTGDNLLCSPSITSGTAGSCSTSAANLTTFTLPDITCKTDIGSQVCAVAELQSIVETRLNS